SAANSGGDGSEYRTMTVAVDGSGCETMTLAMTGSFSSASAGLGASDSSDSGGASAFVPVSPIALLCQNFVADFCFFVAGCFRALPSLPIRFDGNCPDWTVGSISDVGGNCPDWTVGSISDVGGNCPDWTVGSISARTLPTVVGLAFI